MPYRAILFDLDGTLLDTAADLGSAVNRVLARRGLPTHPLSAYPAFLGEGASVLLGMALPEGQRDEATIKDCVAEFIGIYRENYAVLTCPYPEVPEMLDALNARGARLAVLTNKPHAMALLVVARLLPGGNFEVLQGQTPDMPRKPDPAGALDVAQRMSLDPADFLYLGDSATDMETALAAGMYPVGALWGYRSREVLLAGGAHALVETPLQVLSLL